MKTKNVIIISSVVLVLGISAMLMFRKPKDKIKEDPNDAETKERLEGLVGKNVYPSSQYGYTYVRETPEIDDWIDATPWKANWFKKATEKPFATVLYTTEGSDGYTWYKVKLKTAEDGKTEGFVREDAVSFK